MTQSRRLVAIVDDDEKVLQSMSDFLQSTGISVCCFSSAAALLNDGRLPRVDCLITDIAMPEIDGVELARRVALRRPDLPIFFITGDQEIIALAQSAPSCRDRLFKKPFDSRVLLAALKASFHAEAKSAHYVNP